jgi:hypothetical protein
MHLRIERPCHLYRFQSITIGSGTKIDTHDIREMQAA